VVVFKEIKLNKKGRFAKKPMLSFYDSLSFLGCAEYSRVENLAGADVNSWSCRLAPMLVFRVDNSILTIWGHFY
jgi:hypothetical protein